MMARTYEDLSGRTFGRLKVIKMIGIYENCSTPIFRCRCECGTECDVYGNNLRSGQTRSCGCLRREVVGELAQRRWDDRKQNTKRIQ